MNASELIDKQIADLPDWRGKMLARLRKLVHEADAEIVEEWKWSTAVFTHHGTVCAAGAFKDHMKLNFFKGASLKDSRGLFNSGLDAKATRAIDFREGDKIDAAALKELIRAAVAVKRGWQEVRSPAEIPGERYGASPRPSATPLHIVERGSERSFFSAGVRRLRSRGRRGHTLRVGVS